MKEIRPNMFQERLSTETNQELIALAKTEVFVGSLEEQRYSIGLCSLFDAITSRATKLYRISTKDALEPREKKWLEEANKATSDE